MQLAEPDKPHCMCALLAGWVLMLLVHRGEISCCQASACRLTSEVCCVPRCAMLCRAVGPLARTVEDAVRVLDGMAGPDPSDPLAPLMVNVSLPLNYTQFLQGPAGLAGTRIGVLRQISGLPGADNGIQRLFEDALGALQQAGASLADDFRIVGNSLGRDWDANRGGLGPAIGERRQELLCTARRLLLAAGVTCWGWWPPSLAARMPIMCIMLAPWPLAGHWNVGGRWVELWTCNAPLREGLDAYLAAGNTSYRSLQAIYQ